MNGSTIMGVSRLKLVVFITLLAISGIALASENYETSFDPETSRLHVGCVLVKFQSEPDAFYQATFRYIPSLGIVRLEAASIVNLLDSCSATYNATTGLFTDTFSFDNKQVDLELRYVEASDFSIEAVRFQTDLVNDLDVREGGLAEITIPEGIDLDAAIFASNDTPGLPEFAQLVGRKLRIIPPKGARGNYAIAINWLDHFESFTIKVYSDAPKLYGLNFSIFEGQQDPNKRSFIFEEQIRRHLSIVMPHTECVRTFGTSDGLAEVPRLAKELGFCVAAGAWLGRNSTSNEAEIERLISIGQAGNADFLIVGSETMLRKDISEDQLLSYIARVKEAVPNIPVTTGDIYPTWLNHPRLVDAVDVLFANFYDAFWGGVGAEYGIAQLHQNYLQVEQIANGKEVIVSEAGFPWCGQTVGNAVPSPENAAFFFKNFVSWSEANNVRYFYFSFKDEEFKRLYGEGLAGACWGLWTDDAELKPGVMEVLDGARIENNWSNNNGGGSGSGEPEIIFTKVPAFNSRENLVGQVFNLDPDQHAIAVYILVRSRLWIKPTAANPLSSILPNGIFITDITTGGIDHTASDIFAFVVPKTYNPPILLGARSFPEDFLDDAILDIRVKRN